MGAIVAAVLRTESRNLIGAHKIAPVSCNLIGAHCAQKKFLPETRVSQNFENCNNTVGEISKFGTRF
jgi:hypothetical protein